MNCTTFEDRKREWGRLKEVAMSFCDDYHPDVLQNCKTAPSQPGRETTAEPIQISYHQNGKFHTHDADTRVTNNGGSHVECWSDSEGPSEERICCAIKQETTEMAMQKKQWHQRGQSYIIKGWSDVEREPVGNQMVGCMFPMGSNKIHRGTARSINDEEEIAEMVCNMNGYIWESLPFPIIIDSGVCASAMPLSFVALV